MKLLLLVSLAFSLFTGVRPSVKTPDYAPASEGFLIAEGDYTGTLNIGEVNFGNGYTCVPYNYQGENNWFAVMGKANAVYQKMQFGGDGTNKGNYWQGNAQYNNIWWREDFGPDGGFDAIALYRAPFNGTVTFRGTFAKADMSGSDGVVLSVTNKKARDVAATVVATETVTSAFTYVVDKSVEVVLGEMYMFAVGQNISSAYDSTKVRIKATFTQAADPGEEATGDEIEPTNFETEGFLINQDDYGGSLDIGTINFANGYVCTPNSVQGDNNWFAVYGKTDGAYGKMLNEDTTNQGNHWQGSAQYNSVWWRQEFAPDGGDDAIALYRAPFNGTVRFTGRIAKMNFNDSCDGVVISVANKKDRATPTTIIVEHTMTSNFGFIVDKEIDVVGGEMYMFAVGQNINSAYDTTNFNIKATFTQADDPGEEVTGDEIEPVILPEDVAFLSEEQFYILGPENEYLATPKDEQGENNFYAIYGDATSDYYYMKGEEIAGQNQWVGVSQYNSIYWQQDYHPDGGDDAILLWKAPYNGTVRFEGKVHKADFSGSDGVKILAHHRKSAKSTATLLVEREFTAPFTLFFSGAEYTVTAGELFLISVNQLGNSAFDSTKVLCKAIYTRNDADPGEYAEETGVAHDIDYLSYFATEQGVNNWFYTYGTIDKKVLMTFGCSPNSFEYVWLGAEDWQCIDSGYILPGNVYASMRNYVAPQSGKVSILGSIVKGMEGGDGALAKIYLNNEELASVYLTDANPELKLEDLEEIEVNGGDIITYYVDSGEANNNACDLISFKSEIIWIEEREGSEITDPIAFLNPVTKAELYGITLVEPNLDEDEDYFLTSEKSDGPLIGLITGLGILFVAGVAVTTVIIKKRRLGV
ncbi:MAG: hypothetical protein BWY30_00917 [Tenericutes bacterium ADurb.Bin239]|nr:MAG: hypothetical protein BWY30_00917 [Tenericutes bacterium ADurb.Bin239]